MKLHRKRCCICDCRQGEILFDINMKLLNEYSATGLPDKYNVVSCENCGCVFADIDASQEIYNEYYLKCNMYAEDGTIKQVAKDVNLLYLKTIENKIKKTDYILDIGFGDGSLLQLLKEKGFSNLYGIDPSQSSVERLNNIGIEGRCGNIFDDVSEDVSEKFDLVICNMVLEHLYNVKGAIEKLVKYVKRGGGFTVKCSRCRIVCNL